MPLNGLLSEFHTSATQLPKIKNNARTGFLMAPRGILKQRLDIDE